MYLVQAGEDAILIDCGLNYKTLSSRLGTATNRDATLSSRLGTATNGDATLLSRLSGILLTHSHDDHTQGLKVFLKHHPEVPIFANAMTAETVIHDCQLDEESFVCFENGQPFELGPFSVKAFSIPHDTSDPVGYLISVPRPASGEQPSEATQPKAAGNSLTYFHATDVGTPLDSIGVQLAEADLATLESNHDPVMLHNSGRPPSVIQRIYGPRGHLANDQAANLVRRFASPRLKKLALAHLSGACNTPHLAETEMRAALREMNRTDIVLKVFAQDEIVEL